ncbi:hypothetical protein F4780DRAFT_787088 [Xylariomycetidae sp. FL0641]|nr:hypothetical protein F4780DRAFT_787088 [Xylariomycetidae sp. FL0641]
MPLAGQGPPPDQSYPVHIGIWTNWSRGQVLGSTLTLRRQDADLIIAFTAFLVAFVATRVWRILCFFSHRQYSQSAPQDTIYHQRQAILRNSATPEEGLLLLVRLFLRELASKHRVGVLPLVLLATFCVGAFTIAGGLSSQISTAVGDEVLLNGDGCGYLPFALTSQDVRTAYAILPYNSQGISNAADYAEQCYSNAGAGQLDCNRLIKKRLEGTKDFKEDNRRSASCPFKDSMCRTRSANVRLDTGLIDSHKDLGLNAAPSQRLLWRYVLHCAPLVTAGYTSQAMISIGNYTRYHYGTSVALTNHNADYVYNAKSLEDQYAIASADDALQTDATYTLDVLSVNIKNGTVDLPTSNLIPIDPLMREDADIYFVFLSGNGVIYVNPVNDEWYRPAHNASSVTVDTTQHHQNNPRFYLPSEPASPLGCTERYQFCKQNEKRCGPLRSLRDAMAGAAPIFNTSYDKFVVGFGSGTSDVPDSALLQYFTNVFFLSRKSIYGVISQLSSMALLSHRTLTGGIQGGLAINQWQLDLAHIWDTVLAQMQAAFVDMARGTSDPETRDIFINYTGPELQRICRNQKIRSTAYASFSVLGLVITFTLSILLILASYLLEPISKYLYQKKRYSQYAYLEWHTNGTLQLQRLAHEEKGLGTWSGCLDTIPTTLPDEVLGCLDTSDPNHPVLLGPPKEIDNQGQTPSSAPNSEESTNIEVSTSHGTELSHHAPGPEHGESTESAADSDSEQHLEPLRETGRAQNTDSIHQRETRLANSTTEQSRDPLLPGHTEREEAYRLAAPRNG